MPSLNDLLTPSASSSTTAPQRLPYYPTNRLTPPGSVLIPLTRLELVQAQNSINPLRSSVKGKRALHDHPEGEARGGKKKSNGVDLSNRRGEEDEKKLVENHYNARPNGDLSTRSQSPIIGLKNFNNWIKSVLIQQFGAAIHAKPDAALARRIKGLKVLEMGCGKGGDLKKWSKAKTREYFGLDLAAVSVEQARIRWQQLSSRDRFEAHFIQADCFETDISEILDRSQVAEPFDIVSMQFCMHYAFENEHKARQMLSNVSKFLKPGGTFLGTIPDSEKLMDKLTEIPLDVQELSFGNSVYGIKFDERDWTEQFGHRYTFFLQDAVEEVPEYVVHWEAFVDLAREYDLHLEYKADFQDLFIEFKDEPDFAQLLTRMRVVNHEGETDMNPDQWEAATIYLGFSMRKLGEKESALFK